METSWTQFLIDRLPELWWRLGEHLVLTASSTLVAILIGIPLGILSLRDKTLKSFILGAVAILQTIPSLALLTLLLALLDRIGAIPAIIALTLYALLPIVRNTITGLEGVPASAMNAAEGIGMTRWQQLRLVQFPLAVPVIIAGVRTAAVIGVGVATLSAFIGAGGLGQFINRGLALDNTRLILLGAVPSAILALLVDGGIAAIGWALDPMRKSSRAGAVQKAVRVGALLGPIGLFSTAIASHFATRPDLVIASKAFSESMILGHMMADLIEADTDLTVDRRFCLGGTMICHGALVSGEVDLYPEYTGTALTAVLHQPARGDSLAVLEKVNRMYEDQFDARLLPPLGINNTYAIAVRREDALEHGWYQISDLQSDAPDLLAGWTAEFAERPDGYPGLAQAYDFRFGKTLDIDSGAMYNAIRLGEVDVIAAYSTDGRIQAYDLVLLVDDRNFFPPYDAAPVVRLETLRDNPEVADALEPLFGKLTNFTMQRLNYAVDEEKANPRKVAADYLQRQGLLASPQ